MKETALI